MKFNPGIHHRRTIRLHGHDYASAGIYFITICTHERQALFGVVNDGEMVLNSLGEMVAQTWMALADQYGYISMGEFVVMPNHFHGLLMVDIETNPDDTPGNRQSVGRILG